MMEYEWSIDSVAKRTEDNCIVSVTLKCKLKNIDFDGATFLKVKLPPKDDANFIDYYSLTAEQVIQWCWDNVDPQERIDEEYQLSIDYDAESRTQELNAETPSWA